MVVYVLVLVVEFNAVFPGATTGSADAVSEGTEGEADKVVDSSRAAAEFI